MLSRKAFVVVADKSLTEGKVGVIRHCLHELLSLLHSKGILVACLEMAKSEREIGCHQSGGRLVQLYNLTNLNWLNLQDSEMISLCTSWIFTNERFRKMQCNSLFSHS